MSIVPQDIEFAIDTLEIATDRKIRPEMCSIFTTTQHRDNGQMKYKINPDELNGSVSIHSYRKYLDLVNEVLCKADIWQPNLRRIDFRIDNRIDSYCDVYKLNKALITYLTLHYKNVNSYESSDFITTKKLTVRSECKYWEAEYYCKELQESGCGIKSRLEMRIKSGESLVGEEEKYFKLLTSRLNKAINKSSIDMFNKTLNSYLIENWEKEKAYINRKIFIIKNSDSIYNKAQAEDLCYRLGYKDYKQTAAKLDIEFVKYNELVEYKDKLIAAGNRFFES